MEMQPYHHQSPITAIVQHVKRDVEKIERPLAEVEHEAGKLEELLEKKKME